MACSTVQGLSHLHRFQLLRNSLIQTHNYNPKNSLPFFKFDDTFTSILCSRSHRTINFKRSELLCSSSEEGVGVEVEEEEEEENNNIPEEIISGEWPENFSLLNYDDLRAYLEPEIFKEKMQPSALLGEVMSSIARTATVDQTFEEIVHHFEFVSGLPVVDENFRCIGVISKKDKQRGSNGLKSKVGEIMSSPAITLTPEKTVLDAAVLMLKEKFHRIPIVNDEGQVIGIVTRTDVFKALEGIPA